MQIAIKYFFAIISGALLALPAWAQTCHTDSIEQSTPTARYQLNDKGTVIDTETKITWMRCALGQKWDGDTCAGKASAYNWQEAVNTVAEINKHGFAGHHDWRLAYVPELASIIERQCFNPRINLTVFPATPSLAFWTGMEKMGYPNMAYLLDFGGGEARPALKTVEGPVRLMRDGPDGPWWKMPQMP